MKKHLIKFLLFIMLICSFTAFMKPVPQIVAANNIDMPLLAYISSEKSSYGVYDSIKINITIKNISDATINNVSAISDFNDIQPVGSNNTLFVEGKTIKPGESINYSYNARIKSSKLSIIQKIIMFFINLFDRLKSVPNKNYDDGREKVSVSTDLKIGKYSIQERLTVWYETPNIVSETEVIESKTFDEFGSEVLKLVNTQMSSDTFDREQALEEPYYTCRIIACGEDLNNIDLTEFSPDTVIFNEDYTEEIIQFSTQSNAKKCEEYLEKFRNVEFVEPDVLISFDLPFEGESNQIDEPSDYTWGESYVHADQFAHYLELNDYNELVTVAVVDSGVDMDHPFLKGRVLTNGFDYVNNDKEPDDDHGHGTHVTGTIVDCTNNLNIKIMPVKVLDVNGCSLSSSVNLGILHAAINGADVINLSLGGTHSMYIDNAINSAINKGSICVVAAGNGKKVYKDDGEFIDLSTGYRYSIEPDDTKNVCPAHLDNVITVGAIDNNAEIGFFSNYGEAVDLVAPGINVVSSYIDGGYKTMSGTSMATPHISAAAAMFRLRYPDYTSDQIDELLKLYCVDLGEKGRDDYYGNGSLDLGLAIPDCLIYFESNGGTDVSYITAKSTSEIKLPETVKEYKVTLNANGGTIATAVRNVNCPLDGWYRNSSYVGIRYAPGDNYTLTKDETFYAKWGVPQLGNMGIPTKTGCEFLGWFTDPNGGIQYTAISNVSSDITLYAHWKVISGSVTTSGKNTDGKQLKVSWASSGLKWYSNNSAVVYTGTGTSFDYDKCPTQGCYAAQNSGGGPLTCGAAVFEISNIDEIRTYIKGMGAKITKIEFSAVRANTNHGMFETGKGHLWAASNRSSSYKHGNTPNGTKIKDSTWAIGKTFSATITDQAVLNNYLGVGSKDYRSFVFYGGTNLQDYIRMDSISIKIYFG